MVTTSTRPAPDLGVLMSQTIDRLIESMDDDLARRLVALPTESSEPDPLDYYTLACELLDHE